MATPRPLGTLIAALTLAWGALSTHAEWITLPTATSTPFGAAGPDGIFETIDDLGFGGFGIRSAYAGGTYQLDEGGAVLTANVSMISTVTPLGGGDWLYVWEITNSGTGPLVRYFDTGNGPNFLQGPPLFGTAGADRIPGTEDDVAPENEIDTRVGGPPVVGRWGGQWNPEMQPQVDRLEPSPVPAPPAVVLLALGAVGGLVYRRLRRTRVTPASADGSTETPAAEAEARTT